MSLGYALANEYTTIVGDLFSIAPLLENKNFIRETEVRSAMSEGYRLNTSVSSGYMVRRI